MSYHSKIWFYCLVSIVICIFCIFSSLNFLIVTKQLKSHNFFIKYFWFWQCSNDNKDILGVLRTHQETEIGCWLSNNWLSKHQWREEELSLCFRNKMSLTSPWCPHYCLSAPEPAGDLTFQGIEELGVAKRGVGIMQCVSEVKNREEQGK